MGTVFRREQEVHFYDCDPCGRMKISAVNKLLADIADAHYAARGMDHRWLWDNGFVFLLSKVSIAIDRAPGPRETLVADTWEREIKGASFLRDYAVKDAQGNRVFAANTAWMLVNPESWQVLRPSQFPNAKPTGIAADCPQCRKLRLEGGEPVGQRVIRYSDLDGNGHVYNAVYGDIAVDFLPEAFRGKELSAYQVNFVHQAMLGDIVDIYCGKTNENTLTVKGQVKGQDCFFCEFTAKSSF